ncbi:MAG: sulfatase [Sedimentisphaerales bacterium]|nr:sulfatase [Sedimentisphaerales bacterium]
MKAASLAAIAGCITGSVFASKSRKKPNILIILADDATYNDLPLYGGTNVTMPRLKQFASEGKTFNRAYVSMSMCQPCRTELYTGLYPMRTQTCWNHCSTLPETKSVCHYLSDLGYRVGLTGKLHVTPRRCFPFDKVEGFETNCVAPTADYDCSGIQRYMETDKIQPFCLVVGLVVPHVLWTVGDSSHFNLKELKLPPNFVDTPETRRDFAAYLAEIEVLDKKIGDILDTLKKSGCAEDTIVIFSSEQGSQFPGCKWTNYECGVHTGFVVRWPGYVKPSTRTDAMIQYADVLPTLIEAASGTVKPNQHDGTSFLDVLLDKKDTHRQYVYAMHNNLPEGSPYPIRSVRDERYRYIRNLLLEKLHIQKYIMGKSHTHYWQSWMLAAGENENAYKLVSRYMKRPAEELYDSRQDPYELNNLADNEQYADVKKRLSEELDRWMKEQKDPGPALDTLEKLNQSNHSAKN